MTATVAQVTAPVGGQVGPLLSASSVATAITAAGDSILMTIPTLGLKNIGVDFSVTLQALDAFKVSAQFHQDSAFVLLYSAITSTPAGLIIAASGTLASQAASSTGWFIMDVRGIYAVQISVSAAVDGAAVTMRCSGSR